MPLWWPNDEVIGDKVDQAKKKWESLTTNVQGVLSEPILLAAARRKFDEAAGGILDQGRAELEELEVGEKLSGAKSRFDELTAGLTDLGKSRDRLMQTPARDIATAAGQGLGEAGAALGGLGQQAMAGLGQAGTGISSGLSDLGMAASGLGERRDRLMQTPTADIARGAGAGGLVDLSAGMTGGMDQFGEEFGSGFQARAEMEREQRLARPYSGATPAESSDRSPDRRPRPGWSRWAGSGGGRGRATRGPTTSPLAWAHRSRWPAA